MGVSKKCRGSPRNWVSGVFRTKERPRLLGIFAQPWFENQLRSWEPIAAQLGTHKWKIKSKAVWGLSMVAFFVCGAE